MAADHHVLRNFHPGRVTDDGKHIQKFSETARVPFYDNAQRHFDLLDEQEIAGEESVKMWIKKFVKRLSLVDPAKDQRKKRDKKWKKREKGTATFIKQKDGYYYFKVVTSNNSTGFHLWHKPDNMEKKKLEAIRKDKDLDCWVRNSRYQKAFKEKPKNDPDGWEIKDGYLHVVGPSKVEFSDKKGDVIDNFQGNLPSVPADWKMIRTNDFKNRRLKNEPVFCCQDDKGNYYAMAKYCETFFFGLKKKKYEIPEKTRVKYKKILMVYNDNPQAVPETVFQSHIARENVKNLKPGDLVYFKHNDGYVEDIVPVRISRKVDDLLMGERLPNNADRRPCVREILDENNAKNVKQAGLKPLYQHHPKGLCSGCALFGTGFYKSRVSFGFAFPADGNTKLVDDSPYITLPLLERPRPTWSMPDKDAHVPGRKFYVHHQGWKKVVEKSEEDKEGKTKTKNNRTVQALAPDQKFRFEVRFENLRDWELGLLIYALQLENGLMHKLGMAKPLGFGSVDIRVDGVICNGESCTELNDINKKAEEKLRELWEGAEVSGSLEKLFRMLFYIKDQNVTVRYPALKKEDDPDKKDGYEDLKKEKFKKEERQGKLTTPWSPWHEHSEKEEAPS